MLWVGLAIAAHVGNALVFIVDKGLLGTKSVISQPVRYAAYSGLVAAGAAVLLPFGFAPLTVFVSGWSLVAGVLWVAALWLFFIALKSGEPSRVVPIAGSAVPLFTLLFAVLWLGEVLVAQQLVGVLALIVGGALLSIRFGKGGGLPGMILLAAVLSGAAFAAHFAVVDFIYDRFDPFIAAFAYSRLGVGIASLALLVGITVAGSVGVKRSGRVKSKRGRSWSTMSLLILIAFFGSKGLGAVALLLQNYAISLGSVTVVNALQGVQYLFLLLLAIAVSRWWPKLFKEELSRVSLGQKLGGIALIGVGLALIL